MASWWVRTLSSRGCITQISGLCRSWAMKRGWTKRFVCFVFTLGGVISCFSPSTKDGVEFWWKMFEMFRFITLDCFTTISLYGFPMSLRFSMNSWKNASPHEVCSIGTTPRSPWNMVRICSRRIVGQHHRLRMRFQRFDKRWAEHGWVRLCWATSRFDGIHLKHVCIDSFIC